MAAYFRKVFLYSAKIKSLSLTTFSIVSVGFSIGCGKSFQESERDENKGGKATSVAEGVRVEVVETDTLGAYTVRFTPLKDKAFSVLKYDGEKGAIEEIGVDATSTIEDADVVSGQVYEYEIGIYDEDKIFIPGSSKRVVIPYDLVLEENEKLNLGTSTRLVKDSDMDLLRINRLSLGKDSSLITDGKNIVIEINRMISDGGTVATFPSGETANENLNGRSGGEIQLKAKYAAGNLQLFLRGQNGRSALPPPDLGEAFRGKTGEKGTQGASKVIEETKVDSGEKTVRRICRQPPGDGGAGLKGAVGMAGNPSGNGGATGRATVLVDDSDDFALSVKFEPGNPGPASPGSIGGPGGYSGPPGKELIRRVYISDLGLRKISHEFSELSDLPEVCYAKYGKPGPVGDTGPDGPIGVAGEKGKVCVSARSGLEPLCVSEDFDRTPVDEVHP